MDIVEQLVDIYLNKEYYHRDKLSVGEAKKYYSSIIKKGKLIYHLNDNKVVGYIEWYNIDYGQFRRLVTGSRLHIDDEDITNGNICYISSVWIDSNYRYSSVYKILKGRLFEINKECEWFAGEEISHNRRVKIFKNRGN